MIGWRMGSHHLEPSLVIKFSQKIQTLGILHLCVSMLLSLGHTQYSFANPFLFHAIFLSMEGGHNKACAASGVSMENALGRSQPSFFRCVPHFGQFDASANCLRKIQHPFLQTWMELYENPNSCKNFLPL